MSNNTEFKWDDATVLEFIEFTLKNSPLLQGRYTDLEQFKESKQPKPVMFTSEDGINISIGDEYWYVTKDLKIYCSQCDSMTGGLVVANSRQGDRFFSNEEAARDYVFHNKPFFSLQEIKSLGNVGEGNPYYKKLVALAESKLK